MPFKPDYTVPEDRKPYMLMAQPAAGNGRVGALMLHGFMGSPGSSRPMAEYLHSQGISVHCPLLPGHGHYPDKLRDVSHKAWIAEAEEAFDRMRELVDELFIISHSMGTVMAAYLIEKYSDIRGLVMLTPLYEVPDARLRFMGILRYIMPWLYPHKMSSMKDLVRQRVLDFDPTLDFDSPEVQAKLPQMTRLPTSGLAEMVKMIKLGRKFWPRLSLPVLVFQGGHDPAVPEGSVQKIFELLPSEDKQLQTFPSAGHELMRPFEPVHSQVWQMIRDFCREHARLGRETAV